MRKVAVIAGALFSGLLLFTQTIFAQGQLQFSPVTGPVGTKVQAVATGLPPGAAATLIWHTAAPEWRVTGEAREEFRGYSVQDRQIPLTTVQADAEGKVAFEFEIPEDFGWLHNLTLEQDGNVLARQGFLVVKSISIEPTSGPVGTPIRVKATGLGYRTYEVLYHMLYDNAYAGIVTALSTGGTAEMVITATGAPGPTRFRC